MARHRQPVMTLVAERKLADFISPPTHDGVLEATVTANTEQTSANALGRDSLAIGRSYCAHRASAAL